VKRHDVFEQAEAYERYIGRWSRRLAPDFISWLDVAPGSRWLDVGCGTGAFTATILEQAAPSAVVGIDPSQPFVEHARSVVRDPRASFAVGNAMSLDLPSREFDVAAATLVLNFVPDPIKGIKEMRRVVRKGGTVGASVWDYADGMRMQRVFWDAAADLDPGASAFDEGRRRFSICNPDGLRKSFEQAGLERIEVRSLEVEMVFDGFDGYWSPFLGGQGPAPAYAMSLPDTERDRLADLIRSRLSPEPDGSIRMTSSAWAVRGS
jgi:SAM-dependent methyltransferase